MAPERLFDDIFKVSRMDPDGKKFDKVSRVEAHSVHPGIYMQLDVAVEVYPMRVGEEFKMVLASTLNLDGTPDTGYFTQAAQETLADQFDYVMHGKIYKISDYAPRTPQKDEGTSKNDEDTSKKDEDTSSKKDEDTSSKKDEDTSSKKDEDTSSKHDEDTSFKNDEDTLPKQDPKLEIFASFGGLLMLLRGDPTIAENFKLDQRVFLLIRKV